VGDPQERVLKRSREVAREKRLGGPAHEPQSQEVAARPGSPRVRTQGRAEKAAARIRTHQLTLGIDTIGDMHCPPKGEPANTLPRLLRLVQPSASALRDRPDDTGGRPPRTRRGSPRRPRPRPRRRLRGQPERFVRGLPQPPTLPKAAQRRSTNQPERRSFTKFEQQPSHST
jgi:hypothetical protein